MKNTRAKSKRIWPMPEILAGEEYSVKESPAANMVCTDLVRKIMYVPSKEDENSRMSRLHEMAHVAITPTDGMAQADALGIGHDYLNVAEDFRLNQYLANYFELTNSFSEKLLRNRAEGYELANDFRMAALMAVAMYRLPEYEIYLDSFQDEWRSKIYRVVRGADNCLEDTTFEYALEVARYLQDLFESGILNEDLLEGLEDEGDQSLINTAMSSRGEDDLDWGVMTINTPTLSVKLPERRLNRRTKPKEFGAHLMFPDRLDNDDKIFGEHRRVAKGTVLIDVSGSMSISPQAIEALIKAVPGMVIACYSGNGDGAGHLTVLAKKGAMLHPDNFGWPGANEVDGPALTWLGKQDNPRVWVCDGQVTGAGDHFSAKLTREAIRIQSKYQIVRKSTLESAVEYFQKGK